MVEISFAEFKELPKKKVDKKNLHPGKKYYTINSSTRDENFIPVFKGTFSQKVGDRYDFSDVEFVVNPFNERGNPSGFHNNRELKFFEVIEPGEFEINNKNKTIRELNEYNSEKRVKPHNLTPNISFIGKDYRKTEQNFYNTFKKPTSKSSSRINRITNSSSKSSSSKSSNRINRISSPSTKSSHSSSNKSSRRSSKNSKKGGKRVTRRKRRFSKK